MTEFEKELVRFVSGYMDAGVSAEDYVKSFAERLLGVAKEELISRQIVKAESVTETPNDLEEASCKYHRTHTDEVMDYDGYHNGNTKEVYDVTPGESFIAGAKWQAKQDQETIELAEDHAFLAGADWQKKQDEKEQADLFTIVALDAAQRAKEQMMIQWTGNNLKDVIEFTGKSPRFNEWFKSWDDYEDYVRRHGNIFKMFNDDGSHLEVPVGAWIVKTPDKRCVASKFTLKQPESEKIAAAYQLGLADKEKMMMKEAVEGYVDKDFIVTEGPFYFFRSVNLDLPNGFKEGDKVRIIICKKED